MTVAELITELQKMPSAFHAVVCTKADPLDFQGAEILEVVSEDFSVTGTKDWTTKCVIRTAQEHDNRCQCYDCLKQRVDELEQEQRDNDTLQRNKDEENQRFVSVSMAQLAELLNKLDAIEKTAKDYNKHEP